MTIAAKPRIAIIGAGFSGSLLAVQLLRRFAPHARVYLIEKNAKFGCGLAYSTGNPNHRLNVRAGRMSAFADEPQHFVDWLRRAPAAQGQVDSADIGTDTFVPRGLYGAYIQDLLGNEIWQTGNGSNLFLVPDEAVAIRPRAGALEVEVRGGRRFDVDGAVLAVGNFPNDDAETHYFGNPWSPRTLQDLDPDAPVLLTGTGLTMIDIVISLLDQGHRGRIYAVSRRGLLPRRHDAAPPWDGLDLVGTELPRLVPLLREIRRRVRAGDVPGGWRSVIDALRPHTQEIWRTLPDAERLRFLRHLRPWWDVHRHRMAPAVADVVESAVADGRLIVRAARVAGRAPHGRTVRVALRPRGSLVVEHLDVARVIDCSGPRLDYERIDSPLVHGLLADGAVRPGPLGLGLDVTHESALIDRRGVPSRSLYALGPVTQGALWEITSVPDIREQCWRLAKLLEHRLPLRQVLAVPSPAIVVPRPAIAVRSSVAGR